jgi:signal transduction histidine kinase
VRLRAKDPGRQDPKAGPEAAAVDAALAAWRRRATDILLTASAAVHLPVVVLMMLGLGPPASSLVRAFCLTAYLVMAASAVLRRLEYRTRLWVYFTAAYLVVALANVLPYGGPYAEVGLVAHPILVLVLCGTTAAGGAILASAVILVSTPFLRVLPGVAGALGVDPVKAADSLGAYWLFAPALAAFLAALMLVLERFHRFLLGALASQSWEMHERQRLEREIAAGADGERRRLGRELHDGVCQQMTAALLRCRALARRVDRGQALGSADFDPLSALLAESIEEARNVALGLCPLEPDPDALAPALRSLTNRMQEIGSVSCEFLAAGDVCVPDPAVAQHLYRIAQEALSNAMRHARASRITVELRGTDSELALQVEDDGTGLPAERPAGGMGLRTMAYRAQVLGGEFTVGPAQGGGARVTCRVPRAAGAPAAQQLPGDQRWIPAS